MNENLGSLFFAFRAALNQWKSDLAQADSEYMRYKAKWETPVALRGAGAGMGGGGGPGGGGGVASPSTGSGHGGLNVQGMSNGDVTWRLADAVDRHQGRQDSSVAVARSILRRIDKGDIDDEGFRSPGRRTMRRDPVVAAAEAARREFGVASLSADSGPYEMREYDLAPGQSYRQKHRNQITDVAAVPQFGKDPTFGQNLSALGKSKIPIQALVRGTVIGLVVDAISGMAANEATIKQNIALSGGSSAGRARGELQRLTGGLGSIPIVGGLLRSAISPFTTPIETQTLLGEAQVDFQNNRALNRVETINNIAQARSLRLGSENYSAAFGSTAAENAKTRSEFVISSAKAREEFNKQYPVPSSNFRDYPMSGFLPSTRQASANSNMEKYGTEYNTARGNFDRQQNAALASQIDRNNAGVDAMLGSGRAAQLGTIADIHRLQMQNRFRPVGASAAYESESYENLFDPSNNPDTTSSMGRARLRNQGQLATERLRGMQREIVENYRWGEARVYNPYIESPMTFTDRAPETMQDANAAIVTALNRVADVMERSLGNNN